MGSTRVARLAGIQMAIRFQLARTSPNLTSSGRIRDTDGAKSRETPIALGKFRIHAESANPLIDKGGSPTCMYSRLRGHIAFARKNQHDMLFSGQNML
jgi:hypothetical protein